MSHPIDVGSVLGGRYKVTATVLTSHDQDLVLDGVDQVLNRAVSILVAGPDNAGQVAQSAREVATGERPGHVQILDLGVSEDTTYLITNHTSAADLLDLVVSSNPPYVEPFFTDTLGSEIFGQPRSHEPETYDGLYDEEEVDAGYINYGQNSSRPRRHKRPGRRYRRFPRPARRCVRPRRRLPVGLPLPPGPRDWPAEQRAEPPPRRRRPRQRPRTPHPRRPPPTQRLPSRSREAPRNRPRVTPHSRRPRKNPRFRCGRTTTTSSPPRNRAGLRSGSGSGVCRCGRGCLGGPRPRVLPGFGPEQRFRGG